MSTSLLHEILHEMLAYAEYEHHSPAQKKQTVELTAGGLERVRGDSATDTPLGTGVPIALSH
jgi:hypothetical protein